MRIFPITHYLPTIKGLFVNFIKRNAVYPFYASFKITSRCHFGCPFCNMKKDHSKDLSTEEIKTILDNLSRSPVLMTSFEGGEPLLREDIEELLKYARTCKFYLLFTTSVRNILEYPMERYAQYIDFLHISIDEGHDNLEMFDLLPEIVKLPTQVSVQVVVTKDTVSSLKEKARKCHDAGANIVIIPASPMEGADHCFPEIDFLEQQVNSLRKKYPHTIHTPGGYFRAYRKGACSSASVIIAPDGRLFYPCHIRQTKGPDLRKTDLTKWLNTKEALHYRQEMKNCSINCGWYQFYSIDSYISLHSAFFSLLPMIFQSRRLKY